jgi:tRNA threonylcarbamoyladenosine biosynthesis protein TsaB
MIALAFDTSGPVGSVAVLRTGDGEHGAAASVLASELIGAGMRHGVDLFPAVERALRAASVQPREVELVAVGTGPGSYTGLRVGVTAARAFAYAAGARLLGVPSCDAWAEGTAPGASPLAVVVDAKVRAVYIAMYRSESSHWVRTFGPELLAPEEAAALVPKGARIVGDGAAAYAEAFAAHATTTSPDQHPDRADAVQVARLAVARALRGERDAIEDVVPLYLRAFASGTRAVDAPRLPSPPTRQEPHDG